MSAPENLQPRQFFHGSTHDFEPGQILTAGVAARNANFTGTSREHVHMTTSKQFATDYGEPTIYDRTSIGHVYEVQPMTKHLTHDPAMKGLGYDLNDYRVAYRTKGAVRVVRELDKDDLGENLWNRLRVNEA